MFYTNTGLQCIRDLPICEFWQAEVVEPLLTPKERGEMVLNMKNLQPPHDGLKSTGAQENSIEATGSGFSYVGLGTLRRNCRL